MSVVALAFTFSYVYSLLLVIKSNSNHCKLILLNIFEGLQDDFRNNCGGLEEKTGRCDFTIAKENLMLALGEIFLPKKRSLQFCLA